MIASKSSSKGNDSIGVVFVDIVSVFVFFASVDSAGEFGGDGRGREGTRVLGDGRGEIRIGIGILPVPVHLGEGGVPAAHQSPSRQQTGTRGFPKSFHARSCLSRPASCNPKKDLFPYPCAGLVEGLVKNTERGTRLGAVLLARDL